MLLWAWSQFSWLSNSPTAWPSFTSLVIWTLTFLGDTLFQNHGDVVMAFLYVMLIPEMVQHPSPWTVPAQCNVVSSLFFSWSCSFPVLLLVAHKLIVPLLHPQAASYPLLSDRQTAVWSQVSILLVSSYLLTSRPLVLILFIYFYKTVLLGVE